MRAPVRSNHISKTSKCFRQSPKPAGKNHFAQSAEIFLLIPTLSAALVVPIPFLSMKNSDILQIICIEHY